MHSSAPATIASRSSLAASGATRSILTFSYFTLIVYVSVGLPLAVLPAFVHLRMGMHAALAGLVISIQYIATFLSRPWAGRISDSAGAKISVLWGMAACALSGFFLLAAVALHFSATLTFGALVLSRLALGWVRALVPRERHCGVFPAPGRSTQLKSSRSTAWPPMADWHWARRSAWCSISTGG